MAARRTVSVALDVKTGTARKDIRATAADVDKLIRSTEVAGESLDDMAADAAQAGRKLDDMAADAAQAARATEKLAAGVRISGRNLREMKGELGELDRQIDATVAHLRLLEHQFATTGDKSLLKQINSDRSFLKQLQRIRKDLTPGSAPDIADLLGGMPFKVGSIGVLAAAASALAAPIGAAVAGAVIGGVGLGGIVGGVIAASNDGRVKDAFGTIGHDLAGALHEAGRPFLGPLVTDANELKVAAYAAINILHDGFVKLAPVLRPLVRGLDGFVEALGPGLSHAFSAAQPAIRALANELPEIGRALSDMLTTISEDDRATEGLIGLLHATEQLIAATGFLIGSFEAEFDWLVKIGTKLDELKNGPLGFLTSNFGVGFSYLTDQATAVQTSLDKAKDSSQDFNRDLEGVADAAEDAAQKIKDLNDALDAQFNRIISVEEAHIRLQEQWDETTKTLKEGKRTLDITTKAGQENKDALIEMARAAEQVRTAEFAKTGSLDAANRAYDAQLERLRQLATSLHFSKTQVDALVDSVRSDALRKGVDVSVRTVGVTEAQSRLNSIQHTLARLDGSRATATVLIQELHREDARQYRRWGGITEHAAAGTLRDAAVYSPRGPARYAFAEPATGGEAFIPKHGPYGRAMSILGQAAGWYGASVIPHRAAMGGSPVMVNVNVSAGAGAGELAQALVSTLRTEVDQRGGDVQSVLGSRTRTGG